MRRILFHSLALLNEENQQRRFALEPSEAALYLEMRGPKRMDERKRNKGTALLASNSESADRR
jgi:hypothetical protein